MLKGKVKISHVKDLGDARYAAGMGVEMLGFPMSLQEGAGLALKDFENLRAWVAGVRWVAELPDTLDKEHTKERLRQFFRQYAIDMAEVSSAEALELLPKEIAVIFRYRMPAAKRLKSLNTLGALERLSLSRKIDYYLLEGSYALFAIRSASLQAFAKKHPVLLDMDASANDLDQAWTWGVQGFAFNSRPEERPGWKEYAHLADLLEHLQEED